MGGGCYELWIVNLLLLCYHWTLYTHWIHNYSLIIDCKVRVQNNLNLAHGGVKHALLDWPPAGRVSLHKIAKPFKWVMLAVAWPCKKVLAKQLLATWFCVILGLLSYTQNACMPPPTYACGTHAQHWLIKSSRGRRDYFLYKDVSHFCFGRSSDSVVYVLLLYSLWTLWYTAFDCRSTRYVASYRTDDMVWL